MIGSMAKTPFPLGLKETYADPSVAAAPKIGGCAGNDLRARSTSNAADTQKTYARHACARTTVSHVSRHQKQFFSLSLVFASAK